MKHTLKKLSDTSVQTTVELDKTDLATAKQAAVRRLARDVKVPGFRKGKVPLEVAEKHIDPMQLANETAEHALNIALNDVSVAEDLRVLDRPQINLDDFQPYDSLKFTATIEILPDITLGNYKKLKVKRERVTVTDKEVEETIERMRTQLAERKEVKRDARNGDVVTIDFVGKHENGDVFDGGTANDYDLELGSGSFIPGFEDAIVGRKAGDRFDVPLSFPKDYHAAPLKGKKVGFEVVLKKVNENKLPEVDDGFAKKVGPFKTVQAMREDVRAQLSMQKQKEADDRLKDELVGMLVEKSTVPVPQVLVDDQMKQIEQDATQNLMYQGMNPEQYMAQQGYKDHDEWREKEFKVAAERRVQAGLVLAELSKAEKIEVTTDELNVRLATMLEQYASMKDQIDTPEVRRDIANRLLTEKTVDRLVELNS